MMRKSKYNINKAELRNAIISIIVFSSLFFSNLVQKQPSIESSNYSEKSVSKEVSVTTGPFKSDVNIASDSLINSSAISSSNSLEYSNIINDQLQTLVPSEPTLTEIAIQQPTSPVCTIENSVEVSSYSGFVNAIKGTRTCIILTSDISLGINNNENMTVSRDILIKSKDSTKRSITFNYGFTYAHTVITSTNGSNLFLENIKIKINSIIGSLNGVLFASGFNNVVGQNLDINEDSLSNFSNVNVPIFRAQNMYFISSAIFYRSNSSFYSLSSASGSLVFKDSTVRLKSELGTVMMGDNSKLLIRNSDLQIESGSSTAISLGNGGNIQIIKDLNSNRSSKIEILDSSDGILIGNNSNLLSKNSEIKISSRNNTGYKAIGLGDNSIMELLGNDAFPNNSKLTVSSSYTGVSLGNESKLISDVSTISVKSSDTGLNLGNSSTLQSVDSIMTIDSNFGVQAGQDSKVIFNKSSGYSGLSSLSITNASIGLTLGPKQIEDNLSDISFEDTSIAISSNSLGIEGFNNNVIISNSTFNTLGAGPLISSKKFIAQTSTLSSTSFAGSQYYISSDDVMLLESTLNIRSTNHRLIRGYTGNNANLSLNSSSYIFSTNRYIEGTLYYDSNVVQTAQLNNLSIDSISTRKSVIDLSSTSNSGPVVGFAEIYGEANFMGSIDFLHGFLNQVLHYSAWNLYDRETNRIIVNPDFPYIKLMGSTNNVNIGNSSKNAIISYTGSISLFSVYRDTQLNVVNKSSVNAEMSLDRSRSFIDVNGTATNVNFEIRDGSALNITTSKSLQGYYVDYSIFNVLDQSTGVSNLLNLKLKNGTLNIDVTANPYTYLLDTVTSENSNLILEKQNVPLELTTFTAIDNSNFTFKTTDNRHPIIRTNSFITDNSNVMIQANIPYATSEFKDYTDLRYHIFDSSDVSINNPFEFKFGLTPTASNYQGGRLSIESTLSNGLGQQLLINTKDLTKVPYIKASIEGNYAFTKNQHASNHTIDRLSIIDSNIPMGKLTFDWNGTTYTDSLYNLQRVVANDTNHTFDIPAPGTHFGFMWRRSTFVMGDFVTSFDENLRLEDGVYYFDFKVPLESTLEIWDGNTNLMAGVTITGQKQSVPIQNYNGGIRQLKIVSISTVPGMIASNFAGSQNLQKRFSLNVGVSKLDLQIGNDLSFGSVPLDNDMRNIPRLQPYSITVIDSDPSSTGWKLRLCVSDQLKPSDSSKLIANAFKYYDPISGVSSSIPELSCETNGIVIAESNTSTSLSGHVITWQPDNGILASIRNPWSLLIHEQYSATFKFTLTKN